MQNWIFTILRIYKYIQINTYVFRTHSKYMLLLYKFQVHIILVINIWFILYVWLQNAVNANENVNVNPRKCYIKYGNERLWAKRKWLCSPLKALLNDLKFSINFYFINIKNVNFREVWIFRNCLLRKCCGL